MITVRTSLDDLPRRLQNFGDQIPYATSLALNDAAFGLMREEKSELGKQLTLRNTWTQRGMRVDKANKVNLTAEVGNIRWYVESLIAGGQRKALQGIIHNGQRYLIVPSREFKTATGKLRRIPRSKKAFVFEHNDSLLLAYRKTKKRKPLVIVGRLVLRTEYDANTYDQPDVVTDYLDRHWPKHWLDAMERAAASAR